MNWEELILEACAGKAPAFISTATTGLKPETDELLGVCITTLDEPGKQKLMLRRLPADRLAPAAEFHGITTSTVDAHGVSDEELMDTLATVFDNHPVFTYNPAFQVDFLFKLLPREEALFNLPLLLKCANSRMTIELPANPDLLYMQVAAARLVGQKVTFRQICSQFGVSDLDASKLPLERSLSMLLKLWEHLREFPAIVQEIMF